MKDLSRGAIVELLSEFMRAQVTEEKDSYHFSIKKDYTLIASFEEFDKLSSNLPTLKNDDETALYNDSYYEVIVREESIGPISRTRDLKTVLDSENGFEYEISPTSSEYLVWLLNEFKEKYSPKDTRYLFPHHSMRIQRFFEANDTSNLFEFLSVFSFRFLTLKIRASKSTSLSRFTKLTHSFLFHLGFNLDVALVPQKILDEITRFGRITRMRRSKSNEIDPPRRIYNESLVQHYLLAVSSDSPVIEYLSYYHVVEHFYESVFNEDLLNSIKDQITAPSFSYKRKKDINDLVKSIKHSLQIRSETITFSEFDALKLCLMKYIDIPDLCSKLSEYDENLLVYYKTKKVPFSGGKEVDLTSKNLEDTIKALAKRIYSTRNALVHSKEGDKGNYTPFKDNRALIKEVPLLRFISEMVIIEESEIF